MKYDYIHEQNIEVWRKFGKTNMKLVFSAALAFYNILLWFVTTALFDLLECILEPS